MQDKIRKQIRENLNQLNENYLKDQLVRNMGLSHASHNVWNDRSGNQFRWDGSKFVPVSKEEIEKDSQNREAVLVHYPNAKITPVARNPRVYSGPLDYHVTYEKLSRGKVKLASIGKGDSPEEAWEQAKTLIDINNKPAKKDSPVEENLNKDLLDRIEQKKSERNWDALRQIQTVQVEKFVDRIIFDKDDIGTRVKAKKAKTWDDLIDVIKSSKLKAEFNG